MPGRQRLAIVGAGPSAVRAIHAALDLYGTGQVSLETIALHTASHRWTAPTQLADEAIEVAPTAPSIVSAVERAAATAVWPAFPWASDANLADACRHLGVAFLAPDPRTCSREVVRAACRRLGLAFEGGAKRPKGSRLSVVVATDGGRCHYLGTAIRTFAEGVELAEAGTAVPKVGMADILATAAIRLVEETGGRGVIRVSFCLDGADLAVIGIAPGADPLSSSLEAVTGLDLTRLQMELGEGRRLRHRWTPPRGHAIATQLTLCSSREADPSSSLDLLHFASGHGVRIDPGLRQGDVVGPGYDPFPLAVLTGWGRDRDEAITRALRAVDETVIVVSNADTNRHAAASALEALLPTKVRRALDEAKPTLLAEAVALLAGAVDRAEAEESRERERFYASAARGRPDTSDAVGRQVELRSRGHRYRFEVLRSGRDDFLVEVEGASIPVRLERRGPFEARLETRGQRHRILIVGEPSARRIDVDGRPFTIAMSRGDVVVAPAPALVVACRVRPGDWVGRGDPLIVLEAMKTEMTLTAPAPGMVVSVADRGLQVAPGAPLVRLQPSEEEEAEGDPVDFSPAAHGRDEPGHSSRLALEDLRRLALGYDANHRGAGEPVERWSGIADERAADDPEILEGEESFLGLFADLSSVTAPRGATGAGTAREPFLAYLRNLDPTQPALPVGFVDDLRRALQHYGIESLDRTPALEDALFRLFRAGRRLDLQVSAVCRMLDRRLANLEGLRPLARPGLREVLDRLVSATHEQHRAVADLAREVRYRFFDQPVLERAREEVYRTASEHIEALVSMDDTGSDREEHIDALVTSPQPMRGMLIGRMAQHAAGVPTALLEALVRRYYRIRQIGSIRIVNVGGRPIAVTEYEHEGKRIRLHSVFAREAELVEAIRDMAGVLGDAPAGWDVLTDYFVWRETPLTNPEGTAGELQALLRRAPFGREIRRVVFSFAWPGESLRAATAEHFTFRTAEDGYTEDPLYRGLHPMLGKRLDLWRLENFTTERLPSAEDVYLFRAVARENPKDERLFALAEVRDLTPVRNEAGRVVALPHLERMLTEALAGIRLFQSHRADSDRLVWNRVLLNVWPPLELEPDELFGIVQRLSPLAEGLGLEKVVVKARIPDPSGRLRERVLHITDPIGHGLTLRFDDPSPHPINPLTPFRQKVVQSRRRGLTYPYEIIEMLTPERTDLSLWFPPGDFTEYDLDDAGRLVPVRRPWGENDANVIVGVIRNFTPAHPEGMTRVILLGDPTHALGSLAEPECRRIIAGLDLAQELGVPMEWFALSAGARISMDSGVENMDWIALVLRRLIEFTQAGGEVNIVVCGINVGAQPYWNAEATMLMHTKGILVMAPDGAMVLTGKQALDFSGGVSADDNLGIGGYDRVMGPNGQAQYWASDLGEACRILFRHYDHTYVVDGERFPRRVPTSDPFDRDVGPYPHAGGSFSTVGDIFSETANADRKKPFDIRSVMRAAADQDHEPLERWGDMRDGETVVVWDSHLGGFPVCMLGIESKPVARQGWVDADGPQEWTAGTLFPISSKKAARAINAASGNRPLVVLANLSGFDGSPESLRKLQLEYGAEIGRAIVNFRGPIVFCVISRYHGGAFVVFSKALNEGLEAAAVEGSYASVIGGAPAAAVVFARDVETRVAQDKRVEDLQDQMAGAAGADKARLQLRLDELKRTVRPEKLGEVADEFDSIHDIYRAQKMGSVDVIVPASGLRPYLIDAVERGMARWTS